MQSVLNVLVLGYYDRQNMGDECYKHAFMHLFGLGTNIPTLNVQFKCTDDIEVLPEGTDIVICGGGDIINNYFMTKVQQLLLGFTGRVYAVSVGIPYKSAATYFHMFDHVFVRSQGDYDNAIEVVGERNVTLIGDISIGFMKQVASLSKNTRSHKNIGVSLAQPAFFNNPYKSQLLSDICSSLEQLNNELNGNVVFHLLPFNVFEESESECDLFVNDEFKTLLSAAGMKVETHNINNPLALMRKIRTDIDAMVCMRYHSVMFSLITNTPFTALYTTKKVDKLLTDINAIDQSCKMECNLLDKPISFDTTLFKNNVLRVGLQQNALPNATSYIQKKSGELITVPQRMFVDKQLKVPVKIHSLLSFSDVLEQASSMLPSYLGLSSDEYDVVLRQKGPLPLNNRRPIDVARFICYIVTRRTHHATLWGLFQNLSKPDFCLYDALDYIWKDLQSKDTDNHIVYFNELPGIYKDNRPLLDVNNVFNREFADVHRSGWNYVICGLSGLDASQYLRGSGDMMLDTYVDRTFHWGFNTLSTLHVVPYNKPWIGFIHHTFDTSHSSYNCDTLFNNEYFVTSLQNCVGLIALSRDLGLKLKNRLHTLGLDVPVHNISHPMEFVDKLFTPAAYFANPNKSIVQIGAWLRNPYPFYQLKTTKARKLALKGSEMDLYFPPADYLTKIASTLLDTQDITQTDFVATPTMFCRDHICRDNSFNRFCLGVYDMLKEQYESVTICEKLTNEEYDTLLSENIVFLNLVDCSAVNTVMECIVRNTVLVVNRLPALEEVLGANYPGFYNTLDEASAICESDERINRIYYYLSNLDKSRFTLDAFMNSMYKILSAQDTSISVDDTIMTTNISNISILFNRFPSILRFLPSRFRINI